MVVRQSAERLERGERFEAEGRIEDAIEQYEWAIQAYTPFNPNTAKALSHLEHLAGQAEKQGNDGLARKAWQAIVSGLTVIKHVTQPYKEDLRVAEEKLTAIESRLASHPATTGNGSPPPSNDTGAEKQ